MIRLANSRTIIKPETHPHVARSSTALRVKAEEAREAMEDAFAKIFEFEIVSREAPRVRRASWRLVRDSGNICARETARKNYR